MIRAKYMPHVSHHIPGGMRCVICQKLDSHEIHTTPEITHAATWTKTEIEALRRKYRIGGKK